MRRSAVAAALALAALVPATATAAPHDALVKVKQLRAGKGVKTGHELTPALTELYAALPRLSADDRQQAEAILARPDDDQPDPADTHKWDNAARATATKYCTSHFCVHYVKAGPDASNATHAQQLASILENEVFPCESGTSETACDGRPGLGWRQPQPDGGLGGDGRLDVYIQDLFASEGVYGYVAIDPGQSADPAIPHYSYMVLDKDYSRYGSGGGAADTAAAQVTAAHEYNHVLQNAYDYLQDSWMFEATSVWMEEKVYPAINDYTRYINAWVGNPKQPLTAFTRTNLKPYGSAVWNHWLDHQFGAAVVRDAWAGSVAAANFAPGAYGAQIASRGAGGFGIEFDRFAAAAAEWNVPGLGFPDRYPEVPRDGSLPVGNQTLPFALPHTTFSLFDVPVPASAPPTIRLTGTLPSGTEGALALVGRTGSDPNGGTVTISLTPMGAGGIAAVHLDNPSQFARITAVVVNSDTTTSGFDPQLDDYTFTRDANDVVVSMAEPGQPIAASGVAALISDHGAFVNGSIDPHLNTTAWWIEYGRTIAYGAQTKEQELPASTVGAAAVVAPLRNLRANTIYHYRVRARNGAGETAGRDLFFRTARDVTRPRVVLTVRRQRLGRVIRYKLRCSEACRGTAEVVLSRAAARRLGLPRVIARTRLAIRARPRSVRLRVRLSARAAKRIPHLQRDLRGRLRVNVADQARNRRIVTRPVVLFP